MKRRRTAPESSMPSVVVLIPKTEPNAANTRTASASPKRAPFASLQSHPRSSSASALTSISRSSSPPSRPSTLALHSSRASPSKLRRSLLTSSSSSSASASISSHSLAQHHSGSSSSSSNASLSSSKPRHSIRSSQYAAPIDPTDPFGPDDVYMSSKRSPGDGHGLYVCQWRLRDKKDLLDAKGHKYCHCELTTADLLAKHVLSTHMVTDVESRQVSKQKTACKWGTCLNRHYDPAGLAAHVVRDHMTYQLGLKYACIVKTCTTKAILTSLDALDSHHARYHASSMGKEPLRPICQPLPTSKGEPRASQLLATLRKLDTTGGPSFRIPVSARANPRVIPVSERARSIREIKFKKRYLDPVDVRPGEGQDGQPWLRLHKRLQRSTVYWNSVKAADEALFRAVDYNLADLEELHREPTACIELEGDPTLRAIEEGVRQAQIYATSRERRIGIFTLTLPPSDHCQVVVNERSPQDWVESIGPLSLASIEREMNFDASLSKQRRWVDRLRKRSSIASSSNALPSCEDEGGSDVQDSAADWAPPLRLNPYHSSSRNRFISAIEDHSALLEKPLALRQRIDAKRQS